MPDVVNDYLFLPDFLYDQIVSNRKSPETRFARSLAHVRRLGDPRCCLLDTGDEARRGFSIVLRYVCKDLVEIGESAAFIPELHALR